MTSFPDYGLKAQGIGRDGVYGVYRSIFQPYAGMYVVFWCVRVYRFSLLEVIKIPLKVDLLHPRQWIIGILAFQWTRLRRGVYVPD